MTKTVTDIEQSKKLAEILPLESADIWFANGIIVAKDSVNEPDDIKGVIPCWSLAALLNVIPQEILDGNYSINITEGRNNRWVLTYDLYENQGHLYYGLSSGADDLIDACYKLILKLHEHKML